MKGPAVPEQSAAPATMPGAVDLNFLPGVEKRVNGQLLTRLAESELSGFLYEPFASAFRYSLLDDEAKRIRPLTAYATALSLGVEADEMGGLDDYAAVAMEACHTMSLIFDDLPAQDDSPERRHKPTLHVVFGVATAELTAGLMTNWATRVVAETDLEHGLDGDLSRYVGRTLGGLALGQHKDLQLKGKPDKEVSPEELDEIAYLKTALAIEMCMAGTAMIRRASPEVIEGLKLYARYYGLAFQIKDDILDPLKGPGGTDTTGGLDARNRKPNYPSVMGVDGARERFRQNSVLAAETLASLPTYVDTTALKSIAGLADKQQYHQ